MGRRSASLLIPPVAAVLLALFPHAATATSPARLAVREAALGELGAAPADPGADASMVAAAWTAGGFHATGAAAVRSSTPGVRATALFTALCGRIVTTQPGDQPAAGDVVSYADSALSDRGVLRIGVFLSAGEVAVYDASRRAVIAVERQRLFGDARQADGGSPDLALPHSTVACAVTAALIPGVDAADPSTGGVSLVDPVTAADRLDYTASHPRDGDSGVWHASWGTISTTLHGLLDAAGALVARLGGFALTTIDWLHDHVAWFPALAPQILFAWITARVLTATADLRGLHAVLVTVVAVGMALLSPIGWVTGGIVVAAALGRATGLWSPGSLIGFGRALFWNLAVFSVDNFTGIDGSGHTALFSIAIVLAGDLVFFARPALLGLRGASVLAGFATRVPGGVRMAGSTARALGVVRSAGARMLYAGSSTADLLAAKPSALLEQALRTRAAEPGLLLRGLLHVADLGSAAYRGPQVIGSDALTAVAQISGELSGGSASPALLRSVDGLLAACDPQTARIIRSVFPMLRDVGSLGHLRAGSNALSAALQGRAPVTLPASPPAPDGTSWTRGLR